MTEPADNTYMSRPRRYLRRHPGLIAWIGIVLVFSVGQYRQEQETNARVRAACEASIDGRTVLRAVVTTAYSRGGSGDLTKVPGFNEMPESVKVWVTNLAKASANSSSAESQRDELLALIPIPKC